MTAHQTPALIKIKEYAERALNFSANSEPNTELNYCLATLQGIIDLANGEQDQYLENQRVLETRKS